MKFFSKTKCKKIKWRGKKYLFNYLTNTSVKKRDFFFRNKTHFLFFKFVKAIAKKGDNKKIMLLLLNVFNIFFNFIKSYNIFDTDLDDLIEIRSYNFVADRNLFFINFFFKNILELLNPTFNLKLSKIPENLKKETDGKFKDSLIYLFPEKRVGIIFNWLFFYSNTFNDKKFFDRILKSLLYTYFERRSSYLYLKKIEIYMKLIESKKKKDRLGF